MSSSLNFDIDISSTSSLVWAPPGTRCDSLSVFSKPLPGAVGSKWGKKKMKQWESNIGNISGIQFTKSRK